MGMHAFKPAALFGVVLLTAAGAALGEEAGGCSHFSWDVSHELAVMQQAPQPLTAAVKAGDPPVQLLTEHLYELKLAPQASVGYAVPPGKPTLDDSAKGGLVHFRVASAGVYRVSLTTGHWIDVVADGQFIKSRDFQGSRGCERPHKIVEFELPAGKDLTLQFSGGTASSVLVSITAVGATATH
jgi:hypothetical protein